jgi:hypothetical protein
MRITVERSSAAAADAVFATVAHIEQFSRAVAHIVKYEYLSEKQSGVGARFRETRLMNGRAAMTELEVTEYVSNERVRMVADSHGSIWDTVFSVQEDDGATRLSLVMDARAYKLLPKTMNPLIKGMLAKAVAQDMDLVKAHCEA